MTRGLVLGKFLPPHLGHIHLIRAAHAGCDELTVMVCTLAREPIPGDRRCEWMRELVETHARGARVVHVTDDLPQLPEDAPDFWAQWKKAIARAAGEVDLLFTSENYGDRLATEIGARHIQVDRDRRAVPISATAIRVDPMAHWEFIPAPVRPWYARRVVVTGSESTGKTSLARRLASELGTVWSPEYAREYVDAKLAAGATSLASALSADDIEPIARGQIAQEDRLARECNRLLVCDTDVISTAVYGAHYYGAVPGSVDRMSRERLAHLYLLCDIDVDWVPDVQRDRGDRREEMHALFRSALESRGARFEIIRGDWDERLASALRAIRALRDEAP